MNDFVLRGFCKVALPTQPGSKERICDMEVVYDLNHGWINSGGVNHHHRDYGTTLHRIDAVPVLSPKQMNMIKTYIENNHWKGKLGIEDYFSNIDGKIVVDFPFFLSDKPFLVARILKEAEEEELKKE